VHTNFQRCITLHGSLGLLVENNVAFNATGHCYFIEDGWERSNILRNNIGIMARNMPPGTLLESDSSPFGASMFWVTNANNSLLNNVAVGSQFGYWYAPGKHPAGPVAASLPFWKNWPFYEPMPAGYFSGNRAHSVRNSGLFLDDGIKFNPAPGDPLGAVVHGLGYKPRFLEKVFSYPDFSGQFAANLDAMQTDFSKLADLEFWIERVAPAYWAVFEDLTVYKARGFGVWSRGGHQRITNSRFADCAVGASFPATPALVDNSIFIGDSPNVGTPPFPFWHGSRSRPNYNVGNVPIAGIENYDNTGPSYSIRNKFYNYTSDQISSDSLRLAAAVKQVGGFNGKEPSNLYLANKFFSVEAPVLGGLSSNPGLASTYFDSDGTLTGVCGAAVVSEANPILRDPACSYRPKWTSCTLFCIPYVEYDVILTRILSFLHDRHLPANAVQNPVDAIRSI
jgi:hypothetical protein